ncbi:50S ribosomal protein L21e [Candidatus Micrarchaeota archaeon]|nr:50S ribosomal protein L21e [Candidatus Micrarchaeota archaeon]
MVKAKHKGKRNKTRYAYTKSVREKGKPSVNKMLRSFAVNDRVHINVNPSIHSGMPHRRFQGKTGTIVGKQGSCYVVEVKNILATRQIIVHPVHLSKQKFVKTIKSRYSR